MLTSARRRKIWLGGAVLAAGLGAGLAAPALAQTNTGPGASGMTANTSPGTVDATVGEVVVTGRYHVGAQVRRLSAPVSYRDLDLTTDTGREALRQRVKVAAADLCRRLGEQGQGETIAQTSCERDAVNSATQQEEVAFAQATPRMAEAAPPPPAAVPAEQAAAPAAATVTTQTVTNGPVPDTPENRQRYGGPDSRAGRRTAAAGN